MSPAYECLCTQTVSIYRRQDSQAVRTVVDSCFLQIRKTRKEDILGDQSDTSFLLIIPGEEEKVFPGDRILEGVGPDGLSWQQTSAFAQVEYVQSCYWEGKRCHTEAGRGR